MYQSPNARLANTNWVSSVKSSAVMSGRNNADQQQMKRITLSEFQSNYSSVFKSVARTRCSILVTRDGKPLVVIRPVPISAAEEERRRAERDARDLEILNRYADELNAEAEDSLEYQADVFDQP